MADDKVRKLAQEALNVLAAELEAGKTEALQKCLTMMGRFHNYSWRNVLLIAARRPTATQVANYHGWRDLDRQVKIGEKRIMIFVPVLTKQRENASSPSPDKATPNKDGVFRHTGFHTAFVFDVEQTEGRPMPEFANTTGDPKGYTKKLKALVAREGISLENDKLIAPAYDVSYGEKIRILPGMRPAEEFSVLANELANEMLHGRKYELPLPKVVRDTQARAVAYVVSRGMGLETNFAATDYISLYNGEKQTLAQSLSAIQETSSRILEEILPFDRLRGSREKQTNKSLAQMPGQSHAEPGTPNPTPAPSAPQIPDAIDSISLGR